MSDVLLVSIPFLAMCLCLSIVCAYRLLDKWIEAKSLQYKSESVNRGECRS